MLEQQVLGRRASPRCWCDPLWSRSPRGRSGPRVLDTVFRTFSDSSPSPGAGRHGPRSEGAATFLLFLLPGFIVAADDLPAPSAIPFSMALIGVMAMATALLIPVVARRAGVSGTGGGGRAEPSRREE
ncbi:hypothetical protein Q7689_02225 [Nocardiopsis tropica]|nr:hypothetical protein [Nocardiopsis tropica]